MLRKATEQDIQTIYNLETILFDESVRMSLQSIKNSLKSTFQNVLILEEETIIGYMVLFFYKHTIRLYSIGVDPNYQGQGYGKKLLKHLIELGKKQNKDITLEVRSDDKALNQIYESFGFKKVKELPLYYGDVDGYKMICPLMEKTPKTIIVLEQMYDWLVNDSSFEYVYAYEYMNNPKYQNHLYKVINLCDSYKYQSLGYYVSLLAVARSQYVIPSLTTVKDIDNTSIIQSITEDIDTVIQEECESLFLQKLSFRSYFGHTLDKRFQKISKLLFDLLELPFLEIELKKNGKWIISKVLSFHPKETLEIPQLSLSKWSSIYFKKKQTPHTLKTYDYNLAILINPQESFPPSNQQALDLFKKAGEEVGFYVEFITKKDYKRLLEFDALFIRETTNVNHYTYDFARYAYSEGIVVIDDPWSILKCSNKVFLFELMNQHHIPIPQTKIITKNNLNLNTFKNIEYPIIIKEPDSAFSKGVYKADNYKELSEKAKQLLKKSEMIIAQEFCKSEFDWRIGVLNNKAIFACKYFMATGDFKIISYDNDLEIEGEHETIPLNTVPKEVLMLSEQATSLIGDGLYGVDIKEFNNDYKIIEINDNPNIDYEVEDSILGYDLYKIIMKDLYRRIELERHQAKPIR